MIVDFEWQGVYALFSLKPIGGHVSKHVAADRAGNVPRGPIGIRSHGSPLSSPQPWSLHEIDHCEVEGHSLAGT